MRLLTVEQHRQVLSNLVDLGRHLDDVSDRGPCLEYASLMVCFLMHNISATQSLLRLWESFGKQWFPATIGYIIARSMFETDVTAHYISERPNDRASQYILFNRVLDKQEMDTCDRLRRSKNAHWSEAMCWLWQERWAQREEQVNTGYHEVRPRFEGRGKDGRTRLFHNWSGKSVRQMAVAVNHEEAYDVFYTELSSFTHSDVRLANRFLRLRADEMTFSQRASEFDVGNVFRHAASFLTCYLEFFGQRFKAWDSQTVEKCWDVEKV